MTQCDYIKYKNKFWGIRFVMSKLQWYVSMGSTLWYGPLANNDMASQRSEDENMQTCAGTANWARQMAHTTHAHL